MNRIKKCRIDKGYSQKYVAISLGVSQPSVFGWENGKSMPNSDNLKALSLLLDVSVDYLLGIDDTETMKESDDPLFAEKDHKAEIKNMENNEQTINLLSGLTPDNKEKALAYIKYLEFTQNSQF